MQDSTSPSRQSKIHFVPDVDHAPRKSASRQRRSSAPVYLSPMRKPFLFPSGVSTSDSDTALGVFSEEYDLSQEDPRILQDVRRALKLKAKHEAVLKQKTRLSTIPDPSLPLDSLVSAQPRQGIGTPLFPPRNVIFANNSDVDFGPSVGSSNAIAEGHPVPSSLDNGVTLDWSGIGSGNDKSEKRWPLPVKRKGKVPMPHLHILVEQQENAHQERLESIRKQTSPSTSQKALITKDQLTRRYDLLTNPSSSPTVLSSIEVARWYRSQDSVFQAGVEQAEPPTWLKHLQKKRKSTARSPWQLTARIIEEYIHARDGSIVGPTTSNEHVHADVPSKRSLSPPGMNLFPVTSRGSSHISFDPLSYEGLPSFEPLTRSTRDSFDILSRRSGESGYSSPRSKSPYGRRWREDIPMRLQRRLTRESEGVNSARNSSSDISAAGDSPFDNRKGTSPNIQVIVTPDSDLPILSQEENGTTLYNANDNSHSASIGSTGDVGKIGRQQIHNLAPWSENKHPKQISQDKLRREYEAKAQLLEEATAQNHRIRQLLNRISIVVKEYEATQANALAPLGKLQRLPRELLEAFSHDPAAVTGPTRRLQGYKAVDDIHNRLLRQRAICREFLSKTAQRPSVDVGNILRDPAIALKNSLESLHQYKNIIQSKAKEVAELLRKVQDIHTKVKVNYNRALSHTSAVYAELSIIVALEESYKDQYQQFWEIGMDALTFILDSVTPFWRTYGKTIGEDIGDFLIIPLYRNEFTGEAKQYPITCVPRRSLRHWLALALLYLSTATVTFISTRIAITLVTHGGLKSIPYESIRWTALPFFWILIVTFWSLVFTQFIVLFLEVVVILWWFGWLIKVFT